MNSIGECQSYKPKSYFTKAEIEEHTPSRRDGIGHEQESHLLQLYCSYLQDLGMQLKVPQMTIATATILCHRFYMHQSHAKNHWQTVANASMFLACKAEACWLKDLIVTAYKLMYRWDPSTARRIRQKEVYEKHKNLILMGEKLILATLAFDLNIEHPYKSLVAAIKSLEIPRQEVIKVAWNFINDWLRTTLCLQYKPHYIAAGSLFLAAKFQKIKLPSENGKVWWMQFDVSPRQLEEVIQRMLQLLGQSSKETHPVPCKPKSKTSTLAGKRKSESTESCISNEVVASDSVNCIMSKSTTKSTIDKISQKQPGGDANNIVPRTDNCQNILSGTTSSAFEDVDGELVMQNSKLNSGCKDVSTKENCLKIDITGIRERLKRRKMDRANGKKSGNDYDGKIDNEAWIEKELETGVELVYAS